MTSRDALVVRIFAGWTVFVWATRISNVLRDGERDFAFKAVHVGLAAVSVALAVAAWRAVARSRSRAGV
ncbi:MAG: hypothetical protein ACRDZW_01480 [Acidimicrobiales bacterium]